ncbi:MAG: C10 family peptidase [Ferruginibacter sp.]
MKKIIAFLSLLVVYHFIYGKQIDEKTANSIGRLFLTTRVNSTTLKNITNLQLVYKATSKGLSQSGDPEAVNFYVFNLGTSKGFVIVSGDDDVIPVLGYSVESSFDPNNIPPNTTKWLEGYKKEIQYIIEKKIKATDEIKKEWQDLINGTILKRPATIAAVNPLLQTTWNQSPFYNALCPHDNAANETTVTGCVATAMAQIMKYWSYPLSGSGFHSYDHPKYGTLSADFGNTAYQWAAMPNNVTAGNNAVATLMYQVGVSVDMNYGIGSAGGSGAYVISSQSPVTNCAEYALKTYFSYKNSLHGVQRLNYTDLQWVNLLKSEFDVSHPVLYAGFGNGGGHCFVADGYDNNSFIHFNWGWNGFYDGFFQINALNPSGTGTGGGSGGYNAGQQAVIGIEPPTNVQTFDMGLYNYVTPSAASINYAQAFTVSTNIVNNGTANFSGDYCAAIFDNSNNFIDYVEIKSGQSLQAGFAYINDLVFSNAGMVGMLPGTYNVGLFYRLTGGNWIALANNGSYANFVQIAVVNTNDIELNSSITINTGTTLIKGQASSVNVNIINDGFTPFTGQYQVNLYNLDGAFAETIGTYDENAGLPPGFTYLPPYLTFSNTAIVSDPGTYFLAVVHKSITGNWELTGSSYYQNPIKVIVKLPDLQPDKFEDNNTTVQSYTLPLSIPGNNATVSTQGSNCHLGTDYDYYKINLPAGYNYTISARLHDAYNSGNGNTYSLDALFSYSTDGVNWSGAYDDVLPGSLSMSGGHSIYFDVAPYFTGTTGTYLLDIQVTKGPYQYTWTGITSTDWSTGSNWSTGTVPTVTDDITITAGTPFSPVINNGVTGHCKSIKLNNGAKITVSTGANLKVGL